MLNIEHFHYFDLAAPDRIARRKLTGTRTPLRKVKTQVRPAASSGYNGGRKLGSSG